METKITIMSVFFENPIKNYSIRELSRILKINHTTVRKYLNKLTKQGYLTSKKERIYMFYSLNIIKKTLNLKLYYNLEKLRKSNLITDLEQEYDFPVIVLFGSYASAMDDEISDIDICLITNIKKEFLLEKYENKLNRKVSLHEYNDNFWNKAKKLNTNLINSICNGIVLSGELEIL